MNMGKVSLSVVLSLALVPTAAGLARVQTADEIVEKHLAALGGRQALAKLTSRRATGTVSISTPGGDLTGPIELSYKAPNKSRAYMQLDLSAVGVADKMTIEQKFDGTAGWMLNSMQGDTAITGNQLENMKNNSFPSSLLTYKESGIKIEVLPREQIAGKDVIVLTATPKTGSATKLYLDASTYLVVRSVAKLESPEMGTVEQTSDLSDYRTVDGVKMAFMIVNTNPVQTLTIKIDKVEHNVPLDDALFGGK